MRFLRVFLTHTRRGLRRRASEQGEIELADSVGSRCQSSTSIFLSFSSLPFIFVGSLLNGFHAVVPSGESRRVRKELAEHLVWNS